MRDCGGRVSLVHQGSPSAGRPGITGPCGWPARALPKTVHHLTPQR